ncbi:MAG: LLM class flavin-dependent oxidoreductase [Actinomycetota bacterium]|nr:LLM class flavin-dependent oxidoreductase [Actinomycetota bacterium]
MRVCLLPQHDPIVLAKKVGTLDVLSGGRFLVGIGAGWIELDVRRVDFSLGPISGPAPTRRLEELA